MAKKVFLKTDWLKANQVIDVYSISNCMSNDFADYIQYWKHNGYWFFDSPVIIQHLAIDNEIDLSNTKLFYYEVFEQEYDHKYQKWRLFKPVSEFNTNVIEPESEKLEGFDIVTFYTGSSPEHSPLSCNGLAESIVTNEHCLLNTLEEAKDLLEKGIFNNSEPGPYRIFAVYSTEWPR